MWKVGSTGEKNIRFQTKTDTRDKQNLQQLCACIRYFCFFAVTARQRRENFLISRFIEIVNTRQRFSFSFLLTEIQTFRTQLPEKSLTFDKFSVMKQKRWSLKEHLCFYKWGFWYRRRRGCTLNLPIKTEHWTKWSLSQFPCIVCTNQNSAAGLAQSVERSTAEREVAGSIPGAGSIHKVLK